MNVYPKADCGSDHVPIVATMKVRLRTMRNRKTIVKLQIYFLRTNNEHSQKNQQMTPERMKDNDVVELPEGR